MLRLKIEKMLVSCNKTIGSYKILFLLFFLVAGTSWISYFFSTRENILLIVITTFFCVLGSLCLVPAFLELKKAKKDMQDMLKIC